MEVWVLKHGEQLPLNSKQRVYRMGMIALTCSENDNEVTWWTSEFNHAMKRNENVNSMENKSINFKFLKGISYEKNVSLKRIINHRQIGTELQKKMEDIGTKPDVILASMPTIDFAYKAVQYAKKNKVPIIIDIRDLWPDVFMELIPLKIFRNQFLLKPFNKKLKWILENTTGITAITEEYLKWALNKGNLDYDPTRHKVFPIGYPPVNMSATDSPLNKEFLNVIFIGTIGVHFDLDTVLEVAKKTTSKKIRYYIIGDGDKKEALEKKYPLSNVFFTGWLSGEELTRYLKFGDIGIAPYRNTENFLLNIPNKFYEYMAYGIPILTCLPGPSAELVRNYEIGLIYEKEDEIQLEKHLTYLDNNRDVLRMMSEKAIASFKEEFSAELIYQKYYQYVQMISNNNN